MAERPISPTDADVREAWREQHDLETSCAFPGRVQNWDPTTQTCEVVPLVQQQIPRADGGYDFEDLPVIPSVAVLQPRTRGAFLSLPIVDGDTVLCVVLDGDASGWRRGPSNSVVAPRDLRRHHVANAVAVAGYYRHGEALRRDSVRAADAGLPVQPGIVLGYDAAEGTRILIKPDGSVEITRGSAIVVRIDPDGTVHIGGSAGQFVALANLVNARLAEIRAAFNSHTHALAAVPVTGPGPAFAPVGTASGATSTPTALGALADVSAAKAKAT